MSRLQFKYGPSNLNRRVRVAKLRNVLPRHHMGRANRAPMTRIVETPQIGN